MSLAEQTALAGVVAVGGIIAGAIVLAMIERRDKRLRQQRLERWSVENERRL